MNTELVNIFRIAVIVEGGYILILMFLVIIHYLRNIETSPNKSRRVLLGHIILISTSYGILVGSLILEMIIRYGQPMTWRTPTCGIALLLGVSSLHLMIWRLAFIRQINP